VRPAHVFAKPSADGEFQIVALLQGPWRFALRLTMIWLSLRGLTASEIAALFEYDPRTVHARRLPAVRFARISARRSVGISRRSRPLFSSAESLEPAVIAHRIGR